MTVRELAAVPDVGPLLVKGLVSSARKRGLPVEKLPRLSLLLDDQAQDVARLADYCRVVGYGLTGRVAAAWLHLLTGPLAWLGSFAGRLVIGELSFIVSFAIAAVLLAWTGSALALRRLARKLRGARNIDEETSATA